MCPTLDIWVLWISVLFFSLILTMMVSLVNLTGSKITLRLASRSAGGSVYFRLASGQVYEDICRLG